MLKDSHSDTVQHGAAGASIARMVYGINQFMRSDELPLVASEQPIDGDSIGKIKADHERLTYVTRLLGAQQGLRTILSGILVFWIEANDIWHWHQTRGWVGDLAGLVGLVVFVRAWQRWIPRYYEKRFGHVEPHEMSSKQFGILLLVLLALALFSRYIANYFEPTVSSFLGRLHLLISDPAQEVNLYAPFLWMGVFFGSLRWPPRRMERRRLCFELAGLVGFASIALLPMWLPNAERLGLWRVLNAGGLGLSLIVMGLYDHITLVLMLPKKVVEGDDE
jgi:hypothetical protein